MVLRVEWQNGCQCVSSDSALSCIKAITISLFMYLTFVNIDIKHSKNIGLQNDCTYGSPLKHTNIKVTMSIITQAGNSLGTLVHISAQET